MDYLLAAHIQVTGGAEAASQINQVVTQINNFGSATRQANTGTMASDMDKAAQSSSALSQALGRVGDAVVRMATYQGIRAVEDGLRTAKDAVLDFDQAMTESLAIQTGVTSGMRSQMEGMAESLAVKFGEAPNKVADGFYFMASAGLTAQQQIATLPGTMAFAKAGMMDLDQATEMLFDSLSAIGQKSDDPQKLAHNLTNLSDVLTEAAIKSQATVGQMGAALSNKAGASIKAFNLDLNESVGVLEVFADQGIKGTTAGERFSMLIRDMALKSEKFGDVWKSMGVQVFDSAGHFNSLVTIFGQLDTALLPLSGEQRIQKLKEMGFTLRDMSTIMSILGTSGSLGAFVSDLSNAGGMAERVANNQMESLRAKLGQLQAAFKIGAIEGFQKLQEFGSWLASTFAPAIDAVGPALAALGSGMSQVFAGIGATIGGISTLALEGIAKSIEEIGQFASSNTGVVQAFGYALAALAAAKVAESLADIGKAIGKDLGSRVSEATLLFRVLGAEMSAAFSAGGGGVQGGLAAMAAGLDGILGMINPVTVAVAGVAVALGVVWHQHAQATQEAKAAVDGLVNTIATSLGVSADEAAGALARLRSEVSGGAQSFDEMATAARNAMGGAVTNKILTDGLADSFGHLGVTAAQVGEALSTGTNFFEGWAQDTKTIAEMRAQLDQLPPSVRPVAEALLNARENGSITASQFFQLAKSFDFVADAADHTTEAFQKYARDQLGTALANGEIDAAFLHTFGIMDIGKASADQLFAAMQKLQQIKAPVDPLWGEADAATLSPVYTAIAKVGDSAETAEQQVKDFSDALKDLMGGATEMGKLAEISQGMNDLAEAAQKYVTEKGPLADAFTTHTKEANDLQKQVADTAKAHIDFAGDLAEKGSFDQAQQYLRDYRTELSGLLAGFGMGQPEIDALIGRLGLTDAAINGLDGKQANVTVTDNGTAAATGAAIAGAAPPTMSTTAYMNADGTSIGETATSFNSAAPPSKDTLAFLQADGASVGETATSFNSAAPPSKGTIAQLIADGASVGATEASFDDTTRGRTSQADQYPTGQDGVEGAFTNSTRYRNSQADQYATGFHGVENFFNNATRFRSSQADQFPTGHGNVEGAFNSAARFRQSVASQTANTGSAESDLNYTARNRSSTISVNVAYTTSGTVYAGPNGTGIAEGGIVHAYAQGGFENHVAQIGRMGHSRIWNEPETGGEAYIPLALAKRDRSLAIWEETGRQLGATASGAPTIVMHNNPNVVINGSDLSHADLEAAVTNGVTKGTNALAHQLLVELRSN